MSVRRPLRDQPLLITESAVAFYMCYTQEIHVVWPVPYEEINAYELYRNGELIASTDDRSPFGPPIMFDNDKETNLYFKSSLHKIHYTDTDIKKHTKYVYKVIGKRRNENDELMDVWATHEMEVYTE